MTNGFTRADNWLWDYVMPRAKPNTFKVVAAVVRMTAGWHREQAELTFDDLQKMTGIAGRSTLSRAIDDALAEGFIGRVESGRSFCYSTKVVLLDSAKLEPTVSEQNREQSQNGTDNSIRIEPPTTSPKEKINEKKKESDGGGLSAVVAKYEQEIGSLTLHMREQIISALDEFGAKEVVEAINIAAESNVRTWKYVGGVLKRRRANGPYHSRSKSVLDGTVRLNGHVPRQNHILEAAALRLSEGDVEPWELRWRELQEALPGTFGNQIYNDLFVNAFYAGFEDDQLLISVASAEKAMRINNFLAERLARLARGLFGTEFEGDIGVRAISSEDHVMAATDISAEGARS